MAREIERIEAEIRRLKERRRHLRQMPQDNYQDGTVIVFTKRFSEDRFARVYRYAAIKSEGMWYTTGPKTRTPWVWEQLMDWLKGDLHTLRVVTTTSPVRPGGVNHGPVEKGRSAGNYG